MLYYNMYTIIPTYNVFAVEYKKIVSSCTCIIPIYLCVVLICKLCGRTSQNENIAFNHL